MRQVRLDQGHAEVGPSRSHRSRTRSLVTEAQFLAFAATPHYVPLYRKVGVEREDFTEDCALGLEEWIGCGWTWRRGRPPKAI